MIDGVDNSTGAQPTRWPFIAGLLDTYHLLLPPPAPPPVFDIGVGFSSLGSDVVKQADSLRELGNLVTVFFSLCFLFAVTMNEWWSSEIICVRWRNPTHTKGMIVTRSVKMVSHPTRQCFPWLSLGMATPENKQQLIRGSSTSKIKSFGLGRTLLAGCSLPFMRLAEHITALRAW